MDNKDKKDKKEEVKAEIKPKLPINKLTITIIAGVALLLVIFFTIIIAVVMLNKPVPKEKHEEEKPAIMVPLREFIVNLVDYGGRRYLKVKLDLEYEPKEVKKKKSEGGGHGGGKGEELPEEIKNHEAMLRNYIINILSNNSFNDIKTVEGKNILRKNIIIKCNSVLKEGKVLNVYFNDFIIQ